MSQRITPIFLTGFKGIYKAGPAITCPPDMLVECQNAIVQDGAVKKPREEITNAAYTGLSTLDAYSMCFLGNAVASTKAFKIVIG